jgi:hypothetical protein
LNSAYVPGGGADGLLRERERQQVVAVVAAEPCPAQVIGDERRLDPFQEALGAPEVLGVHGLRRTERKRDTVERHRVVAPDTLEDVLRPAAGDHEVLGDDFEPGNAGLVVEDVLVVLPSEADAATR